MDEVIMWNKKFNLTQSVLIYITVVVLAYLAIATFNALLSSILPHVLE